MTALSVDIAFADVIYFKNGGKVEGVASEEAGGVVVIDMGFGTMSVKREEVDRIEKAAPAELEKLKRRKFGYEIERGEWAPPGYDGIRILYNNARDGREGLKRLRVENQFLAAEIAQAEKHRSALLDGLDKKSKTLKGVDAEKDTKRYNSVVADINSLNVSISRESEKLKALYERKDKSGAKAGKLAAGYSEDFDLFKGAIFKKESGPGASDATRDELYFIEIMKAKISEMEGDFKRETALFTPEGGQVIVEALLNGSERVRLLVDTGASIVLISEDTALRLGIKSEDIRSDMKVMLADGSSKTAKPVILKSVKVGDAEVKDVRAAILNRGSISDADGLLGMSFLSNFIMKVDSAENKLILEKVL